MSLKKKEVPFMHWLWLHGPQGEVVRVNALFDGGAMVGAMCLSIFEKVKHCFHSQAKPSSQLLRMANGIIIQLQAVWKGMLELKGIHIEGEFEVFDSGGGWKFLFGKPLLRCFQAVHDFNTDMVSIQSEGCTAILHSNNVQMALMAPTGSSLTSNVEQRGNSVGGSLSTNPPSRQVLYMSVTDSLVQNDESIFAPDIIDIPTEETEEGVAAIAEDVLQEEECCVQVTVMQDEEEQGEKQGTDQGGGNTPPSREVLNHNVVSREAKESDNPHRAVLEYVIDIQGNVQLTENACACQIDVPRVEQEDLSGGSDKPPLRGVPTRNNNHEETTPANTPCLVLPVANAVEMSPLEEAIFTRQMEPFLPACVTKILELVQIGEDISESQCDEIKQLISEFADCFALSLSEVNLIPSAIHKLNIPDDMAFHTKIPQCSFNPDQQAFMAGKIQEMLKGGIICPMHPGEVHCVAPSVLAQKAHENTGLLLDELKHKVNDECVKYGLPAAFDLPPHPPSSEDASTMLPPMKWCLCQDFREINKVMTITPIPQGDICAKQLRLSGHRYVHVFDFAVGFYGIAVHLDSQPYITFYIEGLGYFAYERMPFGITGGPSEFGHMVAQRMHDVITDGTCENFVDDGGSAADSFEEGMVKLWQILECVRREKLSLSPSKLQVFMTEAVFAGARVGPGGVSPNSSKLMAVVNWKIPEDASHLKGFLSLTAYFRDLVKGYMALEKPLHDLLRTVDIPSGTKKAAYQRLMKAHKLQPHWKEEHMATFINLKA